MSPFYSWGNWGTENKYGWNWDLNPGNLALGCSYLPCIFLWSLKALIIQKHDLWSYHTCLLKNIITDVRHCFQLYHLWSKSFALVFTCLIIRITQDSYEKISSLFLTSKFKALWEEPWESLSQWPAWILWSGKLGIL